MDDRARELVRSFMDVQTDFNDEDGRCTPCDMNSYLCDHYQVLFAQRISAYGDEEVIAELQQLYRWVKDPLSPINRDDAIDEIARAINNRIYALKGGAHGR